MLERLKNKKTWAPLVGSVALVVAWFNGAEVPAEAVEAVTNSLSELFVVLGGLLGAVGAWNLFKK